MSQTYSYQGRKGEAAAPSISAGIPLKARAATILSVIITFTSSQMSGRSNYYSLMHLEGFGKIKMDPAVQWCSHSAINEETMADF